MANETIDDLGFLAVTDDNVFEHQDPALGVLGGGKVKADDLRTYMTSQLPIVQKEEVIFSVETDTTYLSRYRMRTIGSNGSFSFDFKIPANFLNLDEIYLVGVPLAAGAAGVGKDIELRSYYGDFGESTTTHDETVAPNLVDTGTSDFFFKLDISGVFTSLGPDDTCGVEISHSGVGGTIGYQHVVLKYERTIA